MCGIVGYSGQGNASDVILDGLRKLEYRGYDSAGVCIYNDGLIIKKDVGKLSDVEKSCGISGVVGNIGIGHVRWATHGGVTANNAHPHSDCKHRIAVVHNGVIENCDRLRDELCDHRFISDTDTEIIAHLIERNILTCDIETAISNALGSVDGDYAVLIMAGSRLFASCRRMPLVFGIDRGGRYVASDVYALPGDCDVMNASDGIVYELDKVDFTQSTSNKAKTELLYADGYHMVKEIMEQPQAILDACQQDKDNIAAVISLIKASGHNIITACGSSRYAALLGRYLLSNVGVFCDVIIGSEFSYYCKALNSGVNVIAVSQSGETKDVLDGVRAASAAGAKIISIVNRDNSLLAKLSDYVLPLNCGMEISVAATKSFIAEVVLFYLLSGNGDGLEAIAHELKKTLGGYDVQAGGIANKLKGANACYFIGRGSNFHIAMEGALKLKEISYIHSEGMPAGELKHGTLSLIEKGTIVVAICPTDCTYNDTMTNVAEVKARGAFVIGVSNKYSPLFDEWFELPSVDAIYYPILAIAPLQLLAYHTALAKGYDPDHPRNLAKSVTVK